MTDNSPMKGETSAYVAATRPADGDGYRVGLGQY